MDYNKVLEDADIPKELTTEEERIAYLRGYTDATRDYNYKLKSVRVGTYREDKD